MKKYELHHDMSSIVEVAYLSNGELFYTHIRVLSSNGRTIQDITVYANGKIKLRRHDVVYKINISTSDDVANAEWNKEAIPQPIRAANGFQAVEIAKQFLIDSGQFTAEEIEDNLLFQIKYIW